MKEEHSQHQHSDVSQQDLLQRGCTASTSKVLTLRASATSTKVSISSLFPSRLRISTRIERGNRPKQHQGARHMDKPMNQIVGIGCLVRTRKKTAM